jgi:hypothetical protein
MSLTLLLAWIGLVASADDGGAHPAMKCAPEDTACIEQANAEYEEQQRRKREAEQGAARPERATPDRRAVRPPAEADGGAWTRDESGVWTRDVPLTPASRERTAGGADEKATPDELAREPIVERRFYRDGGMYLSVLLVDGDVRFVEAHPIEPVERAAAGIEAEELREEQADVLERSARTWVDLAQDELPPALERQIDVEPVPVF